MSKLPEVPFMDQCETCTYYAYDEDYEEYYCSVDMDDCVIIGLTSEKPINTGLANVSPIFLTKRDGNRYT